MGQWLKSLVLSPLLCPLSPQFPHLEHEGLKSAASSAARFLSLEKTLPLCRRHFQVSG